MENIKVKTKNKIEIDRKPRVYFTCHPDDFDKYFKKICDDIFETHDCAIYYTEDMTAEILDEDKQTDLGRNQLFVIPVTFKLLTTPNRAMDVDYQYAKKEHIPVLPIMVESKIDEFYSRPDRFGELQYLSPYSTDLTEIPYKEKLKKYLEAVLISDEMAKRIREAFDAYVFLSYRKKDRKYANKLMRLIHKNPEYRDVAIWFDEFLTPGESFKDNINKILENSKLFALLVTPNLLEEPDGKPNFVMGEEYPAARKSGIDILAAEMESTDYDSLSQKFKDMPSCVNPYDDDALREYLLNTITKYGITSDDNAEHNFLIGLAYLEGIDIEVDRERGIELITNAAENGLPEAMEKLYDLYEKGIGIDVDYHKAAHWAERLISYKIQNSSESNPEVMVFQTRLAVTYGEMGEPEKANQLNKKIYELRCKVLGEEDPYTLASLINLAYTFRRAGQYEEALKHSEKACELTLKVHGENHPDTLTAYGNLALVYGSMGYYQKAFEIEEKIYVQTKRVLGEDHHDTQCSLGNLASYCYDLGKYGEAIKKQNELYEIRCRLYGERHLLTVEALVKRAIFYSKSNDLHKALDLAKQGYALRCEMLGKEHPDTLVALHNLSLVYVERGNMSRAVKLSREVYDSECKIRGEEHPMAIEAGEYLAKMLHNKGDHKEALEIAFEVYATSQKALGEEHRNTLSLMTLIASTYNHLKAYDKAMEWIDKAFSLQKVHLGNAHSDTIVSCNVLCDTYLGLRNNESAMMAAQENYELICKEYGEQYPQIFISLDHLYAACMNLKKYKKALMYTKIAYNISCTLYGPDSNQAKQYQTQLKMAAINEGKN